MTSIRAFLIGLLIWGATSAITDGEIRISEFLALNTGGLEDQDGDSSDWIELHNDSLQPINLSGWSLSDSPENPTRWSFASGSIPPDGFLIVFASGKNRNNVFTSEFHTNFRLDADGEPLILIRPDGRTVVSEFDQVPRQRPDISYGLGEAGTGFQTRPTPGEPNAGIHAGLVEDVQFSVKRGFHETGFEVALSTATPDATILFTTDGSAPFPGSIFDPHPPQVYDTPLRIDTTTVLRALAIRDGYLTSTIQTTTYLFPNHVVNQTGQWGGFNYTLTRPDSDTIEALRALPSLSLAFDTEKLFGPADGIYLHPEQRGMDWEREISVELFYPDGRKGFQTQAGLRIHGRESRAYVKKSFRLNFRGIYGQSNLDFPVFQDHPHGHRATTGFAQLFLRSASQDGWFQTRINPATALYLRNRWTHDLALALGNPGAHSQFVHLYLNGIYWGQYNLMERGDAPFFATYGGGEPEDYDVFNENGSLSGDRLAWEETLRQARRDLSVPANYLEIQHSLDIDHYIRYAMLNHYTLFVGWQARNNYVFGRRRVEKATWNLLAWDADGAFGQYINGNVDSDYTGFPGPGDLMPALQINPDFRLRFADHAQRSLRNHGALTSSRILDIVTPSARELERSLPAEAARWAPGGFPAVESSWKRTLDDLLQNFFSNRAQRLLNQYRQRGLYSDIAAPIFHPHGGSIGAGSVITVTAGSIFQPQPGELFYTLDGSDPANSITAQPYTGPIRDLLPMMISPQVTLKARVQSDAGEWSALAEACYGAHQPASALNLQLSEVLYHPKAGYAEFVELTNVSATNTISLAGVTLAGGVRFAFAQDLTLAPSGRILVVEDAEEFLQSYGPGFPVVGEYSGQLANSGEMIYLVGHDDRLIDRLAYHDGYPWPTVAGGLGFSLTLRDPPPPTESSVAERWRSSAETGGSPGTGDSVSFKLGNDLIEHALGAKNPPAFEIGGAASDGLILPRNPAADDVTLYLEFSSDLLRWERDNGANFFPNRNSRDHSAIWNVRPSSGTAGSSNPLFLRIRIQFVPTGI